MARQAGYYEWDDDLTPGKKKEGGWHQNLYDTEGRLKGSARFVPVDDDQEDPIVVTETMYIPADERLSKTQEMATDIIASVIVKLIEDGAKAATPRVKRWWNETAVPFAKEKTNGWKRRHTARHSEKKPQSVEGIVIDDVASSTEESSSAMIMPTDERPVMSSAEAQARLLAAVAARAYSDEQLRMVSGSQIIDVENVATVQSALARVPREHLVEFIKYMTRNPRLLEESSLANLASLIGVVDQSENMPADGMTYTE
jgi:hypothetical protein